MTRRRFPGGAALAIGCALASAAVIAWCSSSLALAGSTPATIWAPALDGRIAIALVIMAIALVAAAGRAARPAALAIWLVLLAVTSHRVVDGGPDGLRDLWLGVPVRGIAAYAETDAPPRRCRIWGLPALCLSRGGRAHRIATILPFVALR